MAAWMFAALAAASERKLFEVRPDEKRWFCLYGNNAPNRVAGAP